MEETNWFLSYSYTIRRGNLSTIKIPRSYDRFFSIRYDETTEEIGSLGKFFF